MYIYVYEFHCGFVPDSGPESGPRIWAQVKHSLDLGLGVRIRGQDSRVGFRMISDQFPMKIHRYIHVRILFGPLMNINEY